MLAVTQMIWPEPGLTISDCPKAPVKRIWGRALNIVCDPEALPTYGEVTAPLRSRPAQNLSVWGGWLVLPGWLEMPKWAFDAWFKLEQVMASPSKAGW